MPADPIEALLAPLERDATRVPHLHSQALSNGTARIPAYHLTGPAGGGDRIRIGIFGAIHGDEPAGAMAAVHFAENLRDNPGLAQGYDLSIYPICNPTGFLANTRQSSSGKDLNREFWNQSTEPEVRLLETEIRVRRFHGLVSLHSDDTSEGLYGFVRGPVLTRALLAPALQAASQILPINRDRVIDGFAAEEGIISGCYDGILCSPPDARLDPEPFEIILETPQRAETARQERAFRAALQSILSEYQSFLAFATNL